MSHVTFHTVLTSFRPESGSGRKLRRNHLHVEVGDTCKRKFNLAPGYIYMLFPHKKTYLKCLKNAKNFFCMLISTIGMQLNIIPIIFVVYVKRQKTYHEKSYFSTNFFLHRPHDNSVFIKQLFVK
jgi:hypothetical protein